ncbi:hypothetical protein EMIT0P74_40046 [Pseudomonas sp. IT-P74]
MHGLGLIKSSDQLALCRSEPAREEPENNACIQEERVIVDVHREQARSYRGGVNAYE